MKFRNQSLKVIFLLFNVLVGVFLLGSASAQSMVTENDIVKNETRTTLELSYKKTERKSSLVFMNQTLVKLKDKNNKLCYNVYDLLVLNGLSYTLDPEVFMIVDNKVYPMKLSSISYDNVKSIKEHSNEVMLADSSSTTIITGFSENNRKVTRFSYTWNTEFA